ncbi:MAG: hypothetical protein ACREEG_01570, partial [Phenylobacterium sp.]
MTSKARLAAAPASGRRSRTLSEAGPWPRLLQFVDATLPGRITLRDLEEISGLDQYRLIRRCRRDLGVTPHALVLGRRLALAAGLLRRGEAVASVA